MKRKYNTITMLFALLAMLCLAGCNSDGDETIALEYGSPKKMIVGQWKLGEIYRYVNGTRSPGTSYGNWRPGVLLIFYSDGYYTDSSDGGRTRHRWTLGNDYREGEPYYGGITLDDEDFGIDYLGPEHWVLIPGGGGYDDDDHHEGHWILGWDKDDDDDDGGDEPLPDPEPQPEPQPDLIKKVVKTNGNGYTSTWEFTYDSQYRVSTMKTDYFTFSFSYPTETQINVRGYGSGITATLDSRGRITSLLNNGLNATATYSYDTQGYLKEAQTPWYRYNVEFADGSLNSVTQSGSTYATMNYTYERSVISNDANLDLNCFIISPIFTNGIVDNMVLFEPFDLYGKRTATIPITEWGNHNIQYSHVAEYRDAQQRIVKLTYITGLAALSENTITITYY